MVKSKSSKRLKPSKRSSRGIDRISNLSDPLISQILSLLPTKCAVATSVLSTRWKFLWTSITNLDFQQSYKDVGVRGWSTTPEIEKALEMKRNNFTHFVNRVLLLLNPHSIQNFRLKFDLHCVDPSYLNSWISAAFGRTVGEFELSVMLVEPVELPLTRIYCNVVVLKLGGDIQFNIPATASVCFPSLQVLDLWGITSEIASNSSVSFPNLKIMRLNYVKFANDDSVHKLFSSCPILDDLLIERDECDDKGCLIIRIPSLTRLTIDFDLSNFYGMYKLQIDSPALQYLNLNDQLPCEYLPAGNLSSLLQAKIKILLVDEEDEDDDDDNVQRYIRIIEFIGSLSEVKFLSVSGYVLKACRTASANISARFQNLTRLELEEIDCRNLSIVINFLEIMDNLEHLVIKDLSWNHSHQCWWTEPLNVPKCLLSRVATISFNYEVLKCCDQLDLLRYFLKNAEVLQLLTIRTGPCCRNKHELLQKISMFPRGSRTCQVSFT